MLEWANESPDSCFVSGRRGRDQGGQLLPTPAGDSLEQSNDDGLLDSDGRVQLEDSEDAGNQGVVDLSPEAAAKDGADTRAHAAEAA